MKKFAAFFSSAFLLVLSNPWDICAQLNRQMYYHRYIQIDTLIGIDRLPESKDLFFLDVVRVLNTGWSNSKERSFASYYGAPKPIVYNYIVELLLMDTTDQIGLVVDSRGSQVRLTGLRNLPADTIRLSRWEIFKHNLPTTIRSSAFYYRKVGDSIDFDAPACVKRTLKTSGDSTFQFPTISTTIQDRLYQLTLDTVSQLSFRNGHGSGTRRQYRRYLRACDKEQSKNRRSRMYYLSTRSVTYEFRYEGEIQL